MADEHGKTPDRPAARVFVGRERELAELRAGLDDALAGRGGLFLIVGEPGIGKTRLADELGILAAAAAAQVCWARCWEGGGAPAFWPWTVLLRALAGERDTAALAALLGSDAARMATLLPELRDRLTDLPVAPPVSSIESDDARFPLFDATATVLARAAAARPLLLIVDDLHAADHPSLRLLQFVSRGLRDTRLLIVGTYRGVEAEQNAERAALLAGIGRAGHRIPLAGWAEADVGRFVAAAFHAEPRPALLHALHRTTEGNPFFVDEIMRVLIAESGGALPDTATLRIPSSVWAATRQRLGSLTHECRQLLNVAAVVGRDFELPILRAVCALPSERLLAALAEAEAAGLVVRPSNGLLHYAFAHGLIRETLYEDLAPAERPALHRQVGEVLEHLAADGEPPLARLAHHFSLAAPAGEAAKALAYSVRAAERAAALLAYEEAAAHYERALEVGALDPSARPDDRIELRLALGHMHAGAWDLEAARRVFRDVGERARGRADGSRLAQAALGIANLGFGVPRGHADSEVIALLEEALSALGARRDGLWARTAVRLAMELHFTDAAERRTRLSRDAVEVARRIGEPATLAYVINAWHFAEWSTAEVGHRLAMAEEAMQVAAATADPEPDLQARTWCLLDLAEIGEVDTFDRDFDAFAQLVEQRRLPKFLGFAAALRGMRALWAGRFDEACAIAQAAMALGERVGDRAAFMSVGIQLFVARRAQGRAAEIEPMVRLAAERFPAMPVTGCLLALVSADLGQLAEVRREYDRLAADDFAAVERRNLLHPILPYLAELAVHLRDTRRGELLYRRLLPFRGRLLGLGPNVSFGPAVCGLARLAALAERWDDAEQHFQEAVAECERVRGPAWLAETSYEYARALLARGAAGDASRAAELAERAAGIARGLGMAPLAENAERTGARATALAETPTARRPAARVAVGAAAHADAVSAAPAGRIMRPGGAVSGRVVPFAARPQPQRAGIAAVARGPAEAQRAVLRCEGEFWTVGCGVRVLRLKNTSGLRYLAHLLRHPGEEFHALDLLALERTAAVAGTRQVSGAELAELRLRVGDPAGADELLDARARDAYKRRLADLREELDEAERFNDTERAATLRSQIDFLASELARAVGLGGRNRPGSSAAERARLNVTRAIKAVLRKIAAADRDLGLTLKTTVRTGRFCSYTPDPRHPVSWSF